MTEALRSQTDVLKLPSPKSGEAVYFDNGNPKDRATGLALRVRAAGSRKFVFFYRLAGRQLKYTIGDATSWTLDKARATLARYASRWTGARIQLMLRHHSRPTPPYCSRL